MADDAFTPPVVSDHRVFHWAVVGKSQTLYTQAGCLTWVKVVLTGVVAPVLADYAWFAPTVVGHDGVFHWAVRRKE